MLQANRTRTCYAGTSTKKKSIIMKIFGIVLYLTIWFISFRHMTGAIPYAKISVGWFCLNCLVVLFGTFLVSFSLDSKSKEPGYFVWSRLRLGLGISLILGSNILFLLAPYESTQLVTDDTTIGRVMTLAFFLGIQGMIILAFRKSSLYRGYWIAIFICFTLAVRAYERIENLYWKFGYIAVSVAVLLFLFFCVLITDLKKKGGKVPTL